MGIKKSLFKCISLVVAVSVSVFPLPVFAETNVTLPLISQSSYVPANITGLVFSFPDPFHFDVVIEPGDSNLDAKALTAETEKLVRYFMAAVAVPDQDLWVNLSPAEADRIIPNALGQTEMGQNLLAQDYLLKRITASLMDPNHEIGKRFWDAVYEKTQTALGTTNIPVDLLNKVWIVPSKAVVVSQGRAVFVTETHFQVMLEEDYFLSSQNPKTAASQDRMGVDVKNIIRQIIIPEIEKEVNSGKNFADLRQIYNAVILATWFKKHLRNSWLGKAYAERSGVDGIQSSDPHAVETIYQNYLEAFRSGVAESIKEDYDPVLQQTVARSYFSGGAALASEEILEERAPDANPDEPLLSDAAMMATVALNGDEENRFFLAGITEAVDKFGLDERLKAEAKVIEEGVRDGVNGYLQGELKEGKFAAFPQAILDTTITSVMTWLQDEAIDVYTKLGILEAIAQNRWEDITSVHSAKVAFGTAGPRAMAIRSLEEAYRLQKDGFKAIILKGPNSINNVTISLLTTGVARAYKEQNKNDVVITYDTRIAGRYFADLVAAVFIKEGLKVYLFDEAAPMPEMAFAVAHFHKSLGILISASHNPFEYNGYKVSNEVGMQLTPDERRRIEKKVYGDKEQTGISLTDVAWILQASTETPTPSELEASPVDGRLGPLVERFAENSGNLVIMGGEDIQADANGRQHVNVHEAHKQHILNNLLMDSDLAKNGIRKLKVIYSAMYGVGESTFRRITSVLGLTPAVVKEYSRPDGIFSRFS